MTIDVFKLPDARFFVLNTLFPNIAANEFASRTKDVAARNAQGASAFDFACRTWLSNASLARAAGHELPAKPISPPSRTIVQQEADGGTWIAETDGPVYGVCPDLPEPVKADPNVTGLVLKGTPVQPTQDQKLDSIASTVAGTDAKVDQILAALKKAGVAS